jgi:hypothetical protein
MASDAVTIRELREQVAELKEELRQIREDMLPTNATFLGVL